MSYPSQNFLEPETFVSMDANLNHTLMHIEIKRLVDLGPIDFPRQFAHDDKVFRPMMV